ncbi:PD-(D/E)XK nuclease family protein [Candidatus Gracilibacteria bacterium]|nr:PD-(D/E)XK nuclease family protein [Candidatus Gracilibacteria bacterium]NJM86281.1 PD-(D/E)XK nuclease family protein [Hydrococcus sp. RU_2_2]NJP18094.1 PD-(D/E)XK nuclease family protein [Hydrococcus sp. CRU_1_1]
MTDNLIRLSQAHLNLLETCPPQFQRIYLEQLNSPLSTLQQEKLAWGSQFHLLMQQKELGLPIESLLENDEQLQRAIASLIDATPEVWQSQPDILREAEHCRTLNFQGYLLTAIYDLLVINETKATIIDWKTYLQPENKTKIAKNWQTRLYLYILAETSNYLPEEISMTYWFVKLPTQPQSLTFVYNSTQHEKNRQDLSNLLTQLNGWLEDYSNNETPFPHRSHCQSNCPYYQSLLNAGFLSVNDNKEIQKDWMTLIDEIEEVSI